ncbi:MAG: maltotransferase domain-containing protein, partial [Mycobacteriales bacterium]
MIGRVVVTEVSPVVGCGQWPAKAVVGETVPVGATVFREGHELVGATVVLRPPKGSARAIRMALVEPGTDRWAADVVLDCPGRWTLAVEGWADPVATWRHAVRVKVAAGRDVALEMAEGAALLARAAAGVPRAHRNALHEAAARLLDVTLDLEERLALAEDPGNAALLDQHPLRELLTSSARYPIWVDRERALIGAWYEFFPRSEGGLARASERLPAIADMGFDVVYLPPVHPIGETFRKGANNAPTAEPGDPGSPWAIGGAAGGHDTIHPELGTMADFDAFVAAAHALGMEVALDLALQASPDHPWVREHPEWFAHRADGSIAYAENPPKRYQDIYPLSFDADSAGLRTEVLRLLRHWMAHGVRIFRVDNPHTKPLDFWEWLLAEIRSTDPDVLFLAEAFTRPPMMHTLAKIGFHQSYTYFTWRTSRAELEDYLRYLTTSPTADYMRPNLFVNTPDILSGYLQQGGPAAFKVRAVLAATLSPTWGMYSGYELYEHEPLQPGSEEYRDSEKYQLRQRDWSRAESGLAPYLRR